MFVTSQFPALGSEPPRYGQRGGPVDPPANLTPPTIDNGSPIVGNTINVVPGTWSGSPTVTHQWKRDGVAIGGATATTYQVVTADIGKVITVTETATNAGGSASATSDPTATILSNDTSLSLFQVDGSDVNDNDTVNKANGVTAVDVSATPTNAGASRTINGDPGSNAINISSLATGDNAITVRVTAADGITTEDHVVTVHVLDLGLPEITTVTFSGVDGASCVTGGAGVAIAFCVGNDTRNAIWFQTGTESEPDLSGSGVTAYNQKNIDPSASSTDLAAAFADAMDTVVPASASTGGTTTVTVTDPSPGPRVDMEAFFSGTQPVINVTQQGRDPA